MKLRSVRPLSFPLALAALVTTLTAAVPIAAHAEGGITVYGGWRASGDLQDATNDQDLRLRDSASASVALDFGYDASRQLQLYASRQSTSFEIVPANGSAPSQRLPLKITYLHFGGTNFFDGPIGRGPYVAGGLGFTRLTPGLDGFESETRPSLNLGIGYLLPLLPPSTGTLALRIEARVYYTFVNSSGGLFCSGGCTIAIKGDTLQQIEGQIGLTWRF